MHKGEELVELVQFSAHVVNRSAQSPKREDRLVFAVGAGTRIWFFNSFRILHRNNSLSVTSCLKRGGN